MWVAFAVAVAVVLLVVVTRKPTAPQITKYAEISGKDDRRLAVRRARTVADLDKMWLAWEARGMSKEGLLYAEVLRRKQDLGVRLPGADVARISEAEFRKELGKNMPAITGEVK